MSQERRGESCWPHPRESGPRGWLRTRWRDYISELAWSHLASDPAELYEISENRMRYFEFSQGSAPATLLRGKEVMKMNEWKITALKAKWSYVEVATFSVARWICQRIVGSLRFSKKAISTLQVHNRTTTTIIMIVIVTNQEAYCSSLQK